MLGAYVATGVWHVKKGGHKPGSVNKATLAVKEIPARVRTDEIQERDWRKWLNHRDPHFAWDTFKLAQSYLHGSPCSRLSESKRRRRSTINVSAIPKHRVPAN